MPAIDRIVVGRAGEPVGGGDDLLDGGARLAQRGRDVAGVERGACGGDRHADAARRAVLGELGLERVEQRPAAVVGST